MPVEQRHASIPNEGKQELTKGHALCKDVQPGMANLQVTGSVKCTEVTLGSDEDDYIISVTCDKDEQKHSCLVEAIKGLRPLVVKRLLQFDHEFKTLRQ